MLLLSMPSVKCKVGVKTWKMPTLHIVKLSRYGDMALYGVFYGHKEEKFLNLLQHIFLIFLSREKLWVKIASEKNPTKTFIQV